MMCEGCSDAKISPPDEEWKKVKWMKLVKSTSSPPYVPCASKDAEDEDGSCYDSSVFLWKCDACGYSRESHCD